MENKRKKKRIHFAISRRARSAATKGRDPGEKKKKREHRRPGAYESDSNGFAPPPSVKFVTKRFRISPRTTLEF